MKIENFLSVERLTKYRLWAGPNPENVFALYKFNLVIAESWYTPLHILEVTLRNSINKHMKFNYGEDWIVNFDVVVVTSQQEMIEKCRSQIAQKRPNTEVRNSQLVSNLSFAFWTKMFLRKYEQLWREGL